MMDLQDQSILDILHDRLERALRALALSESSRDHAIQRAIGAEEALEKMTAMLGERIAQGTVTHDRHNDEMRLDLRFSLMEARYMRGDFITAVMHKVAAALGAAPFLKR